MISRMFAPRYNSVPLLGQTQDQLQHIGFLAPNAEKGRPPTPVFVPVVCPGVLRSLRDCIHNQLADGG